MQKIVKELKAAVGLAGALEIVRRWGGRMLYVPLKVQASDPLALTLGLDLAQQLVDGFGGQKLQLPIERNALLDIRNAKIVEEHEAGISREQIGLRYGLSRQAVNHILREAKDRKVFAGIQAERMARQSRHD